MNKSDNPLIVAVTTQAFITEGADQNLFDFMVAVDQRLESDDCHPVWFQMEHDTGLLWAVMTQDYWREHGATLNELAKDFGFVPTEG